jgi:hypothetical protein
LGLSLEVYSTQGKRLQNLPLKESKNLDSEQFTYHLLILIPDFRYFLCRKKVFLFGARVSCHFRQKLYIKKLLL